MEAHGPTRTSVVSVITIRQVSESLTRTAQHPASAEFAEVGVSTFMRTNVLLRRFRIIQSNTSPETVGFAALLSGAISLHRRK